jgi:hypothetical protein
MRKLVFVALLSLGAMHATGCIFVSDDDDDGGGGAGFFDVGWTLDPGCPAGATTAQVVSQRVNSAGDPIGSAIEDLFDCEDGSGITAPLPLGDYDVSVNITDESTNDLFAQSDIAEVLLDLGGETVQVDFDILTDDAFFSLGWLINGEVPDATNCADALADGVSVIATLSGTTTATDDVFECEAGEDVTDPIPLGDYTISVSLINAAEEAIDVIDAFEESLEVGNEIVDLGEFDFQP